MNQKKELEKAIGEGASTIDQSSAKSEEGFETETEKTGEFNPLGGNDQTGSMASGGKSIFDRLMNNEPNPPLGEVEISVDEENGGLARIIRGVNKVMGGDIDPSNPPAIIDIALGAFEEMKKRDMLEPVDESNSGDTNENQRF